MKINFLFYIPSYNVLRQFLYIKKKFPKIVPITSNSDLIIFFKEVSQDYIDLSDLNNLPKINKNPIRLIQYWKKKKSIFEKKFKNTKVYLVTTTRIADFIAIDLIVNILKFKKNRMIFLNDDNVNSSSFKINKMSILNYFELCKYRLLYLAKINIVSNNWGSHYGLEESYLKKKKIKVLNYKNIFYQNIDYPHFNLDGKYYNYTLILLGIPEQDDYLVDTYSLLDLYKYIESKSNNLVFKDHPLSINSIKGYPIGKKKVPRYFPVECIAKNFNFVISDLSTSFIYLSKNKVKCISLINLIRKKENYDSHSLLDIIKKDGNKDYIFTPNTIQELDKLLKL